MAHAGGRPLKFGSVEELQEKIEAYFATTGWKTKEVEDSKGNIRTIRYFEPALITGLAYNLGTNRQTLLNYEEKEEFFDTIKKAKEKCEFDNEYSVVVGGANATWCIFSAKNNYGMADKQEVDHTSLGEKIEGINVTFANAGKHNDTTSV